LSTVKLLIKRQQQICLSPVRTEGSTGLIEVQQMGQLWSALM